MKETLKSLLIGFLVMIIVVWAYMHMPLTFRRHKDIKHGNTLIANVQNYHHHHHMLPESQDIKTLESLGFVKKPLGWQPAYQKQDNDSFQIIYQDGFVAPYLYWQSDERRWALTTE